MTYPISKLFNSKEIKCRKNKKKVKTQLKTIRNSWSLILKHITTKTLCKKMEMRWKWVKMVKWWLKRGKG